MGAYGTPTMTGPAVAIALVATPLVAVTSSVHEPRPPSLALLRSTEMRGGVPAAAACCAAVTVRAMDSPVAARLAVSVYDVAMGTAVHATLAVLTPPRGPVSVGAGGVPAKGR